MRLHVAEALRVSDWLTASATRASCTTRTLDFELRNAHPPTHVHFGYDRGHAEHLVCYLEKRHGVTHVLYLAFATRQLKRLRR